MLRIRCWTILTCTAGTAQKRRETEQAKITKLEQEQAAQANKLAWLKGMFTDMDSDGSGAIDSTEVAGE